MASLRSLERQLRQAESEYDTLLKQDSGLRQELDMLQDKLLNFQNNKAAASGAGLLYSINNSIQQTEERLYQIEYQLEEIKRKQEELEDKISGLEEQISQKKIPDSLAPTVHAFRESTQIMLSNWLAHFKFEKFPFDRLEADNEEFASPEFLATCFVQPESFERFLGQPENPEAAVLFAARGSGKSAFRIMAEYYGRTGQLPGRKTSQPVHVLSVPHTRLDIVLEDARNAKSGQVTAELHVREILNRAMVALIELVASAQELQKNIEQTEDINRWELHWFLDSYNDYFDLLQVGFIQRLFASANEPSLTIRRVLEDRTRVSPIEHLKQLAGLVYRLGITAVYVLVDGVDELPETAGEPAKAFGVVRPLLTFTQLLDKTSYCAFKYFLPDQMQSYVERDPGIRLDRGFIRETIHWEEEDLIAILHRRLQVMRFPDNRNLDRSQADFEALCVADLRGQVERELAAWAQGNPRSLLLLCGLMIRHHCTVELPIGQEDPYLLNRQDIIAAQAEFERRHVGGSFLVQSVSTINDETLSLSHLIAQGEGDTLEFKETFQWDTKQNKSNSNLRDEVVVTVVGFANSYGGILLVGVNDDGEIIGLY